jgi:hypothetical protein
VGWSTTGAVLGVTWLTQAAGATVARMPSRKRARVVLLLSGVLAAATTTLGADVFVDRDCSSGGDCNDNIIAWLVGVPLIVAGVALLLVAAVGWRRASGGAARASAWIWTALLALVAFAIGADNTLQAAILAVLAVGSGLLAAWTRRAPPAI